MFIKRDLAAIRIDYGRVERQEQNQDSEKGDYSSNTEKDEGIQVHGSSWDETRDWQLADPFDGKSREESRVTSSVLA